MNDDFFLRNRTVTAIITGGAQGLGFAIAERLAREGAQGVILSGRSLDKGEKAAASIQSHGTDCIFVKADVSVPEDCFRLITTALERFGTANSLVNAAALPDRGTLLDTSPELLDRMFHTNVRGPFLLMQGVVRHLIENRPAREHRQYPLHGGALWTILFVGLLSLERCACYAHEECCQRLRCQSYSLQRHSDRLDGHAR
jgi:NAD(P)-dependent dehydrogenase (short-subunit alcohol dehydrogenase family)